LRALLACIRSPTDLCPAQTPSPVARFLLPLLTVMDELAADTHPGRPDGAEIEVAPHGTRGAGPTDLVEANNEEDGFMDDESGGGDETRGNRSTLKSKARRLWRPEHDKMAVDAIRAAKAHVAPHGKKTKRFEQAADIFNQHPQAVDFSINSKALSDRWSTLKKAFAVKNAADESATGTEPSWTPAEMVLIDAVPEAQAHADLEKASRDEVTKKEERLVAQGEAIRKMAMERRGGLMRGPAAAPGGSTAGPNPSAGGSSDDEVVTPARTTRHRKRAFVDDEDDVVGILERSEKRQAAQAERQMQLAERRLDHERKMYEDEAARRDRAEAAQRDERKAQQELLVALARKLG